MIKINTNQQEVEYQGLFFTFQVLKNRLIRQIDEKDLLPFCIHKTFNPKTGRIDRKYAWDSVLNHLNQKGLLAPVLDEIIKEEYLS